MKYIPVKLLKAKDYLVKKWKERPITDPFDEWFNLEREYVNEYSDDAEANLKKAGWNILSTDTRYMYYGYKIQKGESIHKVTLREALKIKGDGLIMPQDADIILILKKDGTIKTVKNRFLSKDKIVIIKLDDELVRGRVIIKTIKKDE